MPQSQSPLDIAETEASDAIIVYPDRRRMLAWIALSGIPTLGFGLFIIGMILSMVLIPTVRDQAGGVIFLVIFLGSFFLSGAWLTRLLVSFTFSGEPTLLINHAGIRIGKIYGSADIFLPWEEVETVSSGQRPPYKL
ncbi:MAG TPA: hypothetical protein VFN35_20585, partial [Ktedonobacteraceae bacterium]|nr:hypothetical protein [Ktedonobacteraceae bacterium]